MNYLNFIYHRNSTMADEKFYKNYILFNYIIPPIIQQFGVPCSSPYFY